jgi:spore maturation protein CgeB
VRVVIFCHSLRSDWNHGNAHFLRGIATELIVRGHRVEVFEPSGGWSAANLVAQAGAGALSGYRAVYPHLTPRVYDLHTIDLDAVLDEADLVLVHEWSDRDLVARIGEHRATAGDYLLFFHDTHHRTVSEPAAMAAYDLRHYDGVLAFGEVIRARYLDRGWAARAWTWHEAADARVFRPLPGTRREGDLVWIGNWGDGERTEELEEFLIDPVSRLGLRAKVYGVRYPDEALRRLRLAGIAYGGWLPNYRVPEVFARYAVTVHVPRRPYVRTLPGVPTIRPFEALACGIPLVSAPWHDTEHLFKPGRDFLVASTGAEMVTHLQRVIGPDADAPLAGALARHGRRTILARHTCAHRVEQLLSICHELRKPETTAGVLEPIHPAKLGERSAL